ncbi:hypothetical protein SAMN05192558_102586 [Actinokineospora alba]|uniref:Uncharacterized protein n=1 Tax=Actinokineospora alba TaxID=504798 RepID=A0A1H0IJI0_9PSEU|nr:hypothetical protein [Actinokineospora alba]TDP70916.1 hypothetical protein C8E96_6548 [Actinokineospora alba]SDI90156.1 hypothetical protein SAMN05421871_108285 [Actinokineospora alba]SDO31543.1 hypothetical protein SAMN05192558_102586 [Actinokineospora alba]
MDDRSQLLRRQLRMRIVMALLLAAAAFFMAPVVAVWMGFLPHPGTVELNRSLSAAFVLGLPAVACWARIQTLGDALAAESERPPSS